MKLCTSHDWYSVSLNDDIGSVCAQCVRLIKPLGCVRMQCLNACRSQLLGCQAMLRWFRQGTPLAIQVFDISLNNVAVSSASFGQHPHKCVYWTRTVNGRFYSESVGYCKKLIGAYVYVEFFFSVTLEFTDCSNRLVACHLSSFTSKLEQDACSFWNGVVKTVVSQRNTHQADVLSIYRHVYETSCSFQTHRPTNCISSCTSYSWVCQSLFIKLS